MTSEYSWLRNSTTSSNATPTEKTYGKGVTGCRGSGTIRGSDIPPICKRTTTKFLAGNCPCRFRRFMASLPTSTPPCLHQRPIPLPTVGPRPVRSLQERSPGLTKELYPHCDERRLLGSRNHDACGVHTTHLAGRGGLKPSRVVVHAHDIVDQETEANERQKSYDTKEQP